LAIMVGGDAGDLEEARPALAAMGGNIIHVGAVGSGEVAKLCNNLISGSALIAVAEAFRIGEAFGVDPQILTNVIAKSSGGTWVMEHMHPVPGIVDSAASSRQYAPGFMTDLMAKDLALAVNAAREKRVPVAVAATAQQLYRMPPRTASAARISPRSTSSSSPRTTTPRSSRELPARAWLFLQPIYSQSHLSSPIRSLRYASSRGPR